MGVGFLFLVVSLAFSCLYISKDILKRRQMEPRLVLVIGSKGVRLVRMVASCPKEEEEAINLYLKLRKNLRSIDRTLQAEVQLMSGARVDRGSGAELGHGNRGG